MKRFLTISLCLLISTAIAPVGAEPTKKVMNFIAVMDLKCGRGVDNNLSPLLTDMVIEELVKIIHTTGYILTHTIQQ